MVPTESISFGEINPRQDLGDLSPLAWSIKRRHLEGKRGVIQPLIVRKLEGDPNYQWELIDGKRRLQASLIAGISEVPIVEETEETDAKKLSWMSFHANKYRKEFNWFEEAMFYKSKYDEGMNMKEIGNEVGLNEDTIGHYLRSLQFISESEPARIMDLAMETIYELNKCPEEDVSELVNYTVDNKIKRDDLRKILFALRNFKASLEVLKDFHEPTYNELKEKYYPYRFNPKIMSLYQKERLLRTGELQLIDDFKDIKLYPTKEEADAYAKSYHGEVVGRITMDGWQLRRLPYNAEDLEKEFNKLIEKGE